MKVSFFSDGTYSTGVDYSYIPPIEGVPASLEDDGTVITPEIITTPSRGHPECVHVEEVEFDPLTEDISLEKKKGVYIVTITTKPPQIENASDKKSRIAYLLITSENYEEVDTEGVTFEKSEIGPMIVDRYFGGDSNAEMAYLQRWNYLKDSPITPEGEAELEGIRKGYESKEAFKTFILSLA